MGTAVAFALKPLVLVAFAYLIGKPVVRLVGRMKEGKLKRLLLRKMYDL